MMKLSIVNIFNIVLLSTLFLSNSVLAMDDILANQTLYLAVRTLLITDDEPLSNTTIQEIDTVMTSMNEVLSTIVDSVASEVNGPPPANRQLLRGLSPDCSQCNGYPAWVAGCWVSATVWRPHCRRALTVHEELTEEQIGKLSDVDRRRHLLINDLCWEAKSGVSSAIYQSEQYGTLPSTEGATFVEQCIYIIE